MRIVHAAPRGREGRPLRVLGVDPGSLKIGLAVVEGDGARMSAVAFATVRFPKGSLLQRLEAIDQTVATWLAAHRPDVAAVEDVFVRENARSALVLGQARGVALLALHRGGVGLHDYAPARIKAVVAGHGRADKHDMRRMVRLQLGLRSDPPEDAADALAVAMTHLVVGQGPLVALA